MRRLTQTLRMQIERELLKIAHAAKVVLGANRGGVKILPPRKSDSAPRDGYTGGSWISVGRLDRATHVDLWLDHYVGLSSPRLWMGLSTHSRSPIEKLVKLAKFVGFNYEPIKVTSRDITARKPYNMITPLKEDQFERLVYEAYGDTYFLGIYKKYRWPIRARDKRIIANEVKNLVARFSEAFTEASHWNGDASRLVGPWGRPDKKVEKAAVAFMSRKLNREGYKVESHEGVICGYDLYAIRGSKRRYIEVKGCVGPNARFFISRTELKAARTRRAWELAIITNACSRKAKLEFLLSGKQMERKFHLEPTQWEGLSRQNGA